MNIILGNCGGGNIINVSSRDEQVDNNATERSEIRITIMAVHDSILKWHIYIFYIVYNI